MPELRANIGKILIFEENKYLCQPTDALTFTAYEVFKHGRHLTVKKGPDMNENMKNGFRNPDLHIQFFISDQQKRPFMGFTL